MKNKKFDKNFFVTTCIFLIVTIPLIIAIIYKLIETKDFNSINNLTTILFIICILYLGYKLIKDKNFFDKFVNKKSLDKESKEVNKIIIKRSLIFSITFTILDVIGYLFIDKDIFFMIKGISKSLNITLNIIILLLISFIVSQIFEHLILKMYKKGEK